MRRIINQYNQCRLKTVKPGKQLMAELPDSRLQLGFPPFAHVRVDYFGPLMVHQRRSELKRYGCLFTCMTMKAVHLEVTRDLSTDTLINAIRCFVAHRGPVQHTYSDNGTNLVDAERVLRQAINSWDQDQIYEYCRQSDTNGASTRRPQAIWAECGSE